MKTLEYMVAELPIVSTNIADVVELYGPRGQNEEVSNAKPGSKGKVASQRSLLWFR